MNRTLYASDCLTVLNDRDALPDESVDLIYLDPPFNSNSTYNLPFKGKYKSARAVEAFSDTWQWTDKDTERLQRLEADPRTRPQANIVQLAQVIEKAGGGTSLASYLLNMAIRLLAMRRVLKPTGSIYLHCDPTASHYLKLVMDAVFGPANFRNEIIWHYGKWSNSAKHYQKNHDVILFYSKTSTYFFRRQFQASQDKTVKLSRGYQVNRPGGVKQLIVYDRGKAAKAIERGDYDKIVYRDNINPGNALHDTWNDINILNSQAKERMGYPTQKPQALLERIIQSSCPPEGIVLDPFCGCGTTVHAAEKLGRRWVGIDISTFSTGLIRDRIVKAFPQIEKADIAMRGAIPTDVHSARALAERDKFEFEKWVCGHIGASGMFHDPGTPGADGGVDGLMEFYPVRPDKKWKAEYAIVQVKGGNVSPDAVRALRERVDRFEVTAGVMVCFDQHMGTVENQRSRETFSDALGTYPVVQGYSVENLLQDAPLNLPLYGLRRQGALLTA